MAKTKAERRQAKRRAARHAATWAAPVDPLPEYAVARDHDELERIRDKLTDAEYQAGRRLRELWHAGTLNPQPSASAFVSVGMPAGDISDDRLDANDQLRRALRCMGMLGMTGTFCVDVVCYDRPVHMDADLECVRGGLCRLAKNDAR